MRRRAPVPGQADLLSWQPPEPVARFEEVRVRAASVAGKIARIVSESLRQSGMDREAVAAKMSAYLGQDVSKNMLDAYASEAREHTISLVRFIALLEVTRDRRALETLAEMFGWAVIEKRYLTLIDLAAVRERQDELKKHAEHLRQSARADGLV